MRRGNVNGMEEFGMIKKGPWKAEEDEVLICHVNKYGPKDWSSIRSKGLLQRTGKSCRLRWVNKLRPNLKHGTKFSSEEERIVIELQGQFGNKWARIATYLPGRTDNDVKNFWSSRQKRLARLLHTPQLPKSSNQNNNRNRNRNEQVTKLSYSAEDESSTSEPQQCSSSLIDNKSHLMQMLPLPDHVLNPMPISHAQNLLQLEFDPDEKNPTHDSELQFFPFPPIPDLLPVFPPKEEFDTIPNFFDVLGNGDVYGKDDDIAQFPFVSSCFGVEGHCRSGFKRENESPDIIFDELPLDMFDQIEHLQSPHHVATYESDHGFN